MEEKRIYLDEFRTMVRSPLTEADISPEHVWRFRQLNSTFNKNLNLQGKYCYHPFNTVTIDSRGDCFVCTCQAWLPISVGNILDFNSLQEIVQSLRAREIQASIIDGTYRYCDEKTCHLINSKELSGNIEHRQDNINWIVFAIDESCNLSCPSCRTELKFHNKGPEFDLRMRISDHLVKLIQEHGSFLKFTLSGDGDPFASHVYRNLLEKLQIENNGLTEIEIVTNGILVKSQWFKMQGVHQSVVRFKISFDAGSPEVYAVTRRGGDWDKLLESCRYIIDWKANTNSKMQIVANFVVQTANYRDIHNFVRICNELGFDEISFQKVVDWGQWRNGSANMFAEHAVWMSTHANYDELVNILNDDLLADRKIQLNNLSYLRHTVARLSDMVTVKNYITNSLQTLGLREYIGSYENVIDKISEIPGPHGIQAKIIRSDTAQLQRQLDTIEASVIEMLGEVNREINEITKNYHRRGYLINGSYATNRTDPDGERAMRQMRMHPETKETVVAVIGRYADWQYPGLEIGPGDGTWTGNLVACEPLYIVDIHTEFLESTRIKFNERYQNKLRTYLTKETNLDMLPQNQFGFVFSWNVFNYLTTDLIDAYLTEIYKVLKPGGVLMFSYNNADRPGCAALVETGFMSYMPKSLLIELAIKKGYEIIAAQDLEETISWVELRKPGVLSTVKAQPIVGHVGKK